MAGRDRICRLPRHTSIEGRPLYFATPVHRRGTGVFRVAWIPKRSIYLGQPILCRGGAECRHWTRSPRSGRPPTTTAKVAGGKRSSSNLGNQVLALATGKTQQQIAAACKGARPNHVAPPFPATSGRAASKSAMGNSTPYSQRARSNRPRSDTGIKGAGRLPRNRWFESCSLQQRVCELPVPANKQR